MVGVIDILQRTVEILDRKMAKNPASPRKKVDHMNINNALMLFNMSILPLIASFTSALSSCITSASSCFNCCCCEVWWCDYVCSLLCWGCCCCRSAVLGL